MAGIKIVDRFEEKFECMKSPGTRKTKSGAKAAGFEDLDGDGNEIIDDAIYKGGASAGAGRLPVPLQGPPRGAVRSRRDHHGETARRRPVASGGPVRDSRLNAPHQPASGESAIDTALPLGYNCA